MRELGVTSILHVLPVGEHMLFTWTSAPHKLGSIPINIFSGIFALQTIFIKIEMSIVPSDSRSYIHQESMTIHACRRIYLMGRGYVIGEVIFGALLADQLINHV